MHLLKKSHKIAMPDAIEPFRFATRVCKNNMTLVVIPKGAR
jgi:hypothetical protein